MYVTVSPVIGKRLGDLGIVDLTWTVEEATGVAGRFLALQPVKPIEAKEKTQHASGVRVLSSQTTLSADAPP